ncbi:cation efflux protein [Exidia glandulosa HHB12029]|uniref:Cation efflux protein n=1 Tax=Exidia glandulosa HHB12029 TaxID=1314781 RepID=A0A165N6F7_EXIGL|nr:cation efflux protein [Exidia glandulosa HHB12029]
MATARRRHNHTQPEKKSAASYSISSDESDSDHDHHGHAHGNGHSHSHSHSLFHSHDHDNTEGNKLVLDALAGKGDRGGRITLIGLMSNVGLTVGKGVAGWSLNSASLLADAGHSLSDLLGDFVTLFCWRLSRRPPSDAYPYGYAKFETMGTAAISLLLIGGAIGIGWHSFYLLMDALAPSIAAMPSGAAQDLLQALVPSHEALAHAHEHGHGHSHGSLALDPNAAWFALAGVLIKEYLYRITKRVAIQEHSPVLHANALHHRSDAYTGSVALVAILGNWAFPGLPLDPLGGVLVSLVIVMQSSRILYGALRELTDAGVSPPTQRKLVRVLDSITDQTVTEGARAHAKLVALDNLRAVRSGSLMFVDVTARVRDDATLGELNQIEDLVRDRLVARKKEVHEVRVRFRPVETP